MKSTRLLAVMAIGMMASLGQAAAHVIRGASTPKAPKLSLKSSEPSRTVGSSRNGGRRSGNRAVQRASIKARNVKRHRTHCKGAK